MNTSLHTLKPAALLCLALLTACGGGGGGGAPTPPNVSGSSLYETSLENGQRVNVTVYHAAGNEAAVGTVAFGGDLSSFSYGSSLSLSSYSIDNGTRTYAVDTSAFFSPNLVALSANAGNQRVWVGGTAWTYARYGYFVDKTPNSDGMNTAYSLRNLPYTRYQRYYSASAPNATYNQAGSKAIGTYVIGGTQSVTVICNISAAFTSPGGSQSSTDFTISGCDNGITTTGYLRAAKTSPSVMSLSSIGTFSATGSNGVFTPTAAAIVYGLGGPNSEELVGTAVIDGNTLVGGVTTRQARFVLAFGAKK